MGSSYSRYNFFRITHFLDRRFLQDLRVKKDQLSKSLLKIYLLIK